MPELAPPPEPLNIPLSEPPEQPETAADTMNNAASIPSQL
jgi:hypothetical protein